MVVHRIRLVRCLQEASRLEQLGISSLVPIVLWCPNSEMLWFVDSLWIEN